jgi:cell division topological specificity factor
MGILERLLGRSSSAGDAKNRLKVVLIHDRAEIPPGMLDEIKNDIVAIISRRLNIDAPHVAVNVDEGAACWSTSRS